MYCCKFIHRTSDIPQNIMIPQLKKKKKSSQGEWSFGSFLVPMMFYYTLITSSLRSWQVMKSSVMKSSVMKSSVMKSSYILYKHVLFIHRFISTSGQISFKISQSDQLCEYEDKSVKSLGHDCNEHDLVGSYSWSIFMQ